MPMAKNGDVDVFYEITGSGEPLVLIMGLGADHTVWEKHLAAYEKNFRCLAIDNRGVGRSSKPDAAYSTAEMADDVAAAMDHAGDLQSPCRRDLDGGSDCARIGAAAPRSRKINRRDRQLGPPAGLQRESVRALQGGSGALPNR